MHNKAMNERQPDEEHLFNLHVGSKIRQRRLMLNLTQTGLAEKLGLTFQQVQKYEHGQNRVSAGRLLELAGALQVPIAFFYQGLASQGAHTGFGDGGQEPLEGRDAPEPTPSLSHETDALLRAYYRIDDEKKRKSVLAFIRAMTGDGEESNEK